MKIYTIGVYGTDENSFFDALLTAQIDLFCDVRQRRGVRGSQYRYVNSNYLQAKLETLDIAYQHFKELAPSTKIRESQYEVDKAAGIAKRKRELLSPNFIQAYESEILNQWNSSEFIEKYSAYQNICFFCVECLPDACHRSLLAAKLAQDTGIKLEHLQPCQASES